MELLDDVSEACGPLLAPICTDRDGLSPGLVDEHRLGERVFYLYSGARSGWMLVHDGRLRRQTKDPNAIRDMLAAEMLEAVLRSYEVGVLIPGSIVDEKHGQRLEVLVRPAMPAPRETSEGVETQTTGNAEIGPGVLIVPENRSSMAHRDLEFLGMRVVPVSGLSVMHVDLCPVDETVVPDRDGGTGTPTPEHAVELTYDQGVPWVVSSIRDFGNDPAAGLDLLLEAVQDARTTWRGGDVRQAELWENAPATRDLKGPEATVPGPPVAGEDYEDRVCWRTVPDLILRRFEEGWLAVNPKAPFPVFLDDQSAAILRLLDGQTSLQEVADVVEDLFQASPGVVRSGLDSLVRLFGWNALISHVPAEEEEEEKVETSA